MFNNKVDEVLEKVSHGEKCKKIVIQVIFISLLALVFVGSGNMQAYAESTESSESAPVIEIYDAKELQAIGEHPEKHNPDATFVLMNDIDCSGVENFQSIPVFEAEFDGAGYTITNYHAASGVIDIATETAYIHDVTIEGTVEYWQGTVGGLVDNNSGAISNCSSNVDLTYSEDDNISEAGGLVGMNYGTIENCNATGNVVGKEVGGLVGWNLDTGAISNSYATGDVSSDNSDGAVSGGGLVGHNNGEINNSYATGDVTAGYEGGGLVGSNDGKISNSYATGDVTSDMDAGGLVSWNRDNGTVTNSYAIGDVTSDNDAGGLVGTNTGEISDTYATGDVAGHDAGGVVGTSTRLIKKVSNSYSYESQEIEAKIVVFRLLAEEKETKIRGVKTATYDEVSSTAWHQDTVKMGDQFIYSDGHYPQVIDSNTGEPLPGQEQTEVRPEK